MKYKVGDKVKIVKKRAPIMSPGMDKHLGTVMTIERVQGYYYSMVEDGGRWSWNNECIEGYANIIKKSDLQDGDITTYRDGKKRFVHEDGLRSLKHPGSTRMGLNNYDEDLFYEEGSDDLDIVKVYRPETEEIFYTERAKKVKEMTVAEIEKELGYSIKVIKEDK